MGCVLSVSGTNLDVDSFIKNTELSGFNKKHKGDLISISKNKRLEYSWASILISGDDYDDINLQMKEAEGFLIKNKNNLKFIAITKEIDYATINFGIHSKIDKPKASQSFFFPPSLLLICSELKLGLELTIY